MQELAFPPSEYAARAQTIRKAMEERDLDALLLASPEDIYYLTGLTHQGHFAFTLLVFPRDGQLLIVARSMEAPTIAAQLPDVTHVDFGDDEEPADGVLRAVRRAGLTSGRLGLTRESALLTVRLWERLRSELGDAIWEDGSGIVGEIRSVKSPAEIACVRRAAALSDRGMRAGIEAAGVGVNEREVAAAVYSAMITGGSEYPGFAPFIRSTPILSHEHVTWRDHVLAAGDELLIELSACACRYHAPLTRMVSIGRIAAGTAGVAEVAVAGLEAVRSALRPGVASGEVYDAWQQVVDEAFGPAAYRRHHCGYAIGIGFPPSWVGGATVAGLRAGGTTTIREGMVFHLLSWILGQPGGDYGVSDTVVVGPAGAELLTSTPRGPRVAA